MSVYSRWWKETETMLFIFILITVIHLHCVQSADDGLRGNDHGKTPQSGRYRLAEITISYKEKNKDELEHFTGKFGLNSVTKKVEGIVTFAVSTKKKKKNHWGCKTYDNKIPTVKWIALVERGECPFSTKVKVATQDHNASAVVVYDGGGSNTDPIMNQGEKNSISIFISHGDGTRIISIINRGSSVKMQVVPGKEIAFDNSAENNISKTSVLFVSISFIVLMIISLAWLVFYYIQRFRYSHAKERLARRLACAAKKAIAKIPQSTVKSGDKVLEGDHDQCAVCIEQYKLHDVIRILPCTHIFHKSCVDPWLQENRSCPMCKMDILAAYGMQIGTSQESVLRNTPRLPRDDPEVSSSVEEAAASADVVLPFICLHNNMEGEDDDTQQASSQLLGAGPSCENIGLSSTSLHSNKSDSGSGIVSLSSRVERRDKEESNRTEMKALIQKELSRDDEEEEYIDDNKTISKDSNKSYKGSKEKKTYCHADGGSSEHLGAASLPSLPKGEKGDEIGDDNVAADGRSNKDPVSIIVYNIGGGDSIGAVEFHQEQDLSPSDSVSHA